MMRHQVTAFLLLLAAVLLLLPEAASARDRRWPGHPVWRSQPRAARVVIVPQRGRTFSRPPGWDRGRKVGWGNCDLPPGLAKKYGCHGSRFIFERPRRGGVVIAIPLP